MRGPATPLLVTIDTIFFVREEELGIAPMITWNKMGNDNEKLDNYKGFAVSTFEYS